MIKNISPLRYPGGKKNLTPFLANILKINQISNGTYVEPFAGGAGAALNLLCLEYVYDIIINDADYFIYSFWKSILTESERFKKRIQSVKVSLNTWHRQKKILKNPKRHSMFEIGFAAFFLNRCNRSGILNAGPIGGFNQTGKWKIDARFNKQTLIDRVEKIATHKNRIKVFNLDAIDFLENISETAQEKSCFFYLDPPYYLEGKNLYLNYYKNDDHQILSNYIQKKLKSPWILSYDNAKEIKSLYKESTFIRYDLKYSVNTSKTGKEIMFFSNNLKVPKQKITI